MILVSSLGENQKKNSLGKRGAEKRHLKSINNISIVIIWDQ